MISLCFRREKRFSLTKTTPTKNVNFKESLAFIECQCIVPLFSLSNICNYKSQETKSAFSRYLQTSDFNLRSDSFFFTSHIKLHFIVTDWIGPPSYALCSEKKEDNATADSFRFYSNLQKRGKVHQSWTLGDRATLVCTVWRNWWCVQTNYVVVVRTYWQSWMCGLRLATALHLRCSRLWHFPARKQGHCVVNKEQSAEKVESYSLILRSHVISCMTGQDMTYVTLYVTCPWHRFPATE